MFQSVYESFRPCVKRPLVSKERNNRALWPWDSCLSVVTQSRTTLLIGWWKPSWCHRWIHSDMFIHQPRITPFQCRHCKALYWCIVQFLTPLNMTVTFTDYVNLISFPNYCLFHHRLLSLCLCLVSTVQTHLGETSRTLFLNRSRFPIGRCVLTEIKTSSSRLVSGKDKGVFWGLVIQSMCFWFPCCPLAKSINRSYCVWDSSRK